MTKLPSRPKKPISVYHLKSLSKRARGGDGNGVCLSSEEFVKARAWTGRVRGDMAASRGKLVFCLGTGTDNFQSTLRQIELGYHMYLPNCLGGSLSIYI